MEQFLIETQQDYEDLCNYIESDKPDIVEIGDDYFVTPKEQFNVVPEFKWIIEDITEYAINGLKKEEPKVEEKPVKEKKTRAKKKIEEPDFTPTKIIEIETASFKIY